MDNKMIGYISSTDGEHYNVDICISASSGRIKLGYFSDAPGMDLSSAVLTKSQAQSLISFLNAAIDEADKS